MTSLQLLGPIRKRFEDPALIKLSADAYPMPKAEVCCAKDVLLRHNIQAHHAPAASSSASAATPASAAPKEAQSSSVDVSRLDMRVGKIVSFVSYACHRCITECSIGNHPDADSLFVEQIDLGEATGLRSSRCPSFCMTFQGHVLWSVDCETESPLSSWKAETSLFFATSRQPRCAAFCRRPCFCVRARLTHLFAQKPLICDSEAGVEPLDPPAGSTIGDRVFAEGFPGSPDEELKPKQKVWETVQVRSCGVDMDTHH
jgi:hypothetical protein